MFYIFVVYKIQIKHSL